MKTKEVLGLGAALLSSVAEKTGLQSSRLSLGGGGDFLLPLEGLLRTWAKLSSVAGVVRELWEGSRAEDITRSDERGSWSKARRAGSGNERGGVRCKSRKSRTEVEAGGKAKIAQSLGRIGLSPTLGRKPAPGACGHCILSERRARSCR